MGLRDRIVSYLGHEYVESLEKKDPALFTFVDSWNEVPILQGLILWARARQAMGIEPDTGPEINYVEYSDRFLKEPPIPVLNNLLREFGLDKLFGVSLATFLDNVASVGEDGK